MKIWAYKKNLEDRTEMLKREVARVPWGTFETVEADQLRKDYKTRWEKLMELKKAVELFEKTKKNIRNDNEESNFFDSMREEVPRPNRFDRGGPRDDRKAKKAAEKAAKEAKKKQGERSRSPPSGHSGGKKKKKNTKKRRKRKRKTRRKGRRKR